MSARTTKSRISCIRVQQASTRPRQNCAKHLTFCLFCIAHAGVRTIFCGHYHRNAGGFDEGLEVVVTSAIGAQLGEDKSGLRVVRVLENEIKHDYYDLKNIPTNVKLKS